MSRLSDDGYILHEIAARVRISRNWAWRLARRHGIRLDAAQGRRRVVCDLTPEVLDSLDALATDAGVARSEMLGRIVRVVLEDPARLRHQLGKLALPKRPYSDSPRPKGEVR